MFVGADGRVRVGDFGLARAAAEASSEEAAREGAALAPEGSLTRTGAVLGTPAYMSPEQYRGAAVDAATDQFSFCVALWEALCGERPFAGATVEELADAVVHGRRRVPPRGRSVPAEVWEALVRGLAVAPADCFPSLESLLETLAGELRARRRARSRRSRRNELLLLERVREFWIEGVLERGRGGAALIELEKAARPDAVVEDGALRLDDRVDARSRPLAPTLVIAEHFERRGRALLILGEPGAGKTTCLIELTRALLEVAARDADAPLPVVLSLSAWDAPRTSLETWVIDQMNLLYRIPRALARGWIADEALALMLDGLDELAPARRPSCVAAINEFRAAHGLTPISVTCRAGSPAPA